VGTLTAPTWWSQAGSGTQPSAGGLQAGAKPPWLLWLAAQGDKPKGNLLKLPHVVSGGILAWKERNLPLLWGTKCSRGVTVGHLEPLTLVMCLLAVLGGSLVALSPAWMVCVSSPSSCQVLLLPPPSPSLGRRSLSQPAPALLSAAGGQPGASRGDRATYAVWLLGCRSYVQPVGPALLGK